MSGPSTRLGRLYSKLTPRVAQLLDDRPLLLVLEVGVDALGDLRADPLDVADVLGAGLHEGVEVVEVRGEELRDLAADVPDAEREEQAVQVAALRRLDVLEDLVGEHRPHALKRDELVLRQEVDVGRVLDETAFEEDRDPTLAEALDVHHAGEVPIQRNICAGHEMFEQ